MQTRSRNIKNTEPPEIHSVRSSGYENKNTTKFSRALRGLVEIWNGGAGGSCTRVQKLWHGASTSLADLFNLTLETLNQQNISKASVSNLDDFRHAGKKSSNRK